jgi:hypothetical protein
MGNGRRPGRQPIQARSQPDAIRVEAVEHGVFCDGCGVEITWVPILSDGRRYCCALCTRGATADAATQSKMKTKRAPRSPGLSSLLAVRARGLRRGRDDSTPQPIAMPRSCLPIRGINPAL